MSDLISQNKKVITILYTKFDRSDLVKKVKGVSVNLVKYYFKDRQINLLKDKHGKPYLSDPNIYISISNSKDIVVCALSRFPIGIDLEYKRILNNKCYRFINDKYHNHFKIKTLSDWVRFESLLKLNNLKLDDSILKEHVKNTVTEEVILDENYLCLISSNFYFNELVYKSIPFKNLLIV